MAIARIGGRYVVRRRLNGGAQGEVYEVFDNNEHDVAVVKLVAGTVPPGGVWQEARILRALEDDHILRIRNADLHLGRPYIATDLATHGTLAVRLAASGSCGLDVDDVVRWIRHACMGVARAHARGLLHNDIKPGNLFLNAEGECLVGDFGLAAALPPGATTTAIPGATAETAAPEIAATWHTGTAFGSKQSDVYSLGATAFWLLAARAPHDFTGAADTAAKMAIVASESPPRLFDVAPHVPQYVAHAIEQAMDRDVAARFSSVSDLDARLGNIPIVGRRWRRTDEHANHLACWRGIPVKGGSTYVVCLEQDPRPAWCLITTRHAGSGNRIRAACRSVEKRRWGPAVRSVIRSLS